MYDYQQGNREGHVVFRGGRAEFLQWAQEYRMVA